MSNERKVPGSRLGRLARLASVGVRTGAGLLLDRDSGGAARHAAEVLGTMRGIAAKVGQMAAYVDGVVPEAHREAYETAMKGLMAAAPTSSAAEVRRVVEEELGAPVDKLFAEFDEVPLASASIGQVHRARLPEGREVAVKVQHPGVARALENDLSNAGLLEGMLGVMGGRRLGTDAMLETMRARFREEVDYTHEAANQRAFRALHAHDPRVHVPEVIDSHSRRRVLTAEFLRGVPFDTACTAPAGERRAWGETLWRWVFYGNLAGGMFNADPHPGNYAFQPGGHVVFYDFGCVQKLSPEHRANTVRVHGAAIEGDQATFAQACRALIHSKPGPLEDLAVGFVRLCFEPLFASPYKITRAYAASLVDATREMTAAARSLPDAVVFSMTPEIVFMNRLQFGFYSVLARLDVELDFAGIERAMWPRVLAA